MSYKILFVDDEAANLRLLERLFRSEYEVFTAASGDEGLALLAVHDVALILSDQRMPTMTGSEFLKRAAEMRPQTVRIMLTGYTDANDLVDAINSGVVYKYITKPWVNEELKQTVKRALQHYETTKAQRQLQAQCERLKSRLTATKKGVADVVLATLERGFPEIAARAARRSALAAAIGDRFDLEWQERETLELSSRLYDAVMFGVPSGRLAAYDSPAGDDLKTLVAALSAGSRALEGVPDLDEVADVLRFRFERFDGSGAPSSFRGSQIPLIARILGAAAAYEKIKNPWTGETGVDHDEAMRILKSESGTRFDPEMVDALSQLRYEIEDMEAVEMLAPA